MALTELPDRAALAARIDDLLTGEQPFVVLGARVELPVDDPTPSDTVAERLQVLVRGTDLLGLLSPHTYVLVATGTDAEAAGLVAEWMKQAFQMPLEVRGQVVSLVVDQTAVVVRPEDLLPGAPTALGERRGRAGEADLPADGMSALAALAARLDAQG